MSNITAVIKNFLRNGKTRNCIDSLLGTYPGIKIIVIDDSYPEYRKEILGTYENLEKMGHKVILTPFDVGVSLGRNIGLENVKTDYTLVGDNDFVYDKRAGVDRMASVLYSRKDIDIVCGGILEDRLVNGDVVERDVEMHYEGFVSRRLDSNNIHYLKYEALNHNTCQWDSVANKHFFTPIEMGFNYFLMRTAAYPKFSWSPEIKVSLEHSDGMLRAKKNGLKMVYLKDAFVKNDITKDGTHPEYYGFRKRFVGWDVFCKNWGVEYGIDFGGGRGDYTTYGY
jgi:glycosyltransferase involved in cell wall biosynthesis